jgi:MYXO-CTERM domain-containing protein
LVTLFISATGHAFEVQRTPSGLPVHWEETNITFEVDPSVARAVNGGYEAVAEALAGWSAQSGAPTMTVTAASGHPQLGVDGHNVIFFAPDGYAAAGNALAITILSYDERTGAIVDADIVINGQHAFGVLAPNARCDSNARPISNEGSGEPGGSADGTFDLVHVLAHEAGHALGLRDVLTPSSVMYLYSTPNDASSRSPATDDEAGIASLYPADSNQTAAGCQASVASASASPPGSAGVLVMALVLVGWAAKRRERAWPHTGAIQRGSL